MRPKKVTFSSLYEIKANPDLCANLSGDIGWMYSSFHWRRNFSSSPARLIIDASTSLE